MSYSFKNFLLLPLAVHKTTDENDQNPRPGSGIYKHSKRIGLDKIQLLDTPPKSMRHPPPPFKIATLHDEEKSGLATTNTRAPTMSMMDAMDPLAQEASSFLLKI